jgi:hypothetical protein
VIFFQKKRNSFFKKNNNMEIKEKKKRNPSKFKLTEDLSTIRKIKKIICNEEKIVKVDDRLFTGEYIGIFVIRYVACELSKQAEKCRKKTELNKEKNKNKKSKI